MMGDAGLAVVGPQPIFWLTDFSMGRSFGPPPVPLWQAAHASALAKIASAKFAGRSAGQRCGTVAACGNVVIACPSLHRVATKSDLSRFSAHSRAAKRTMQAPSTAMRAALSIRPDACAVIDSRTRE